jgi:hypothetical protein
MSNLRLWPAVIFDIQEESEGVTSDWNLEAELFTTGDVDQMIADPLDSDWIAKWKKTHIELKFMNVNEFIQESKLCWEDHFENESVKLTITDMTFRKCSSAGPSS